MTEILEGQLYLGDYYSVKVSTEQLIEDFGITDFINVASEVSYSNRIKGLLKDNQVEDYKFHLMDSEDELRRKFVEVVDLMNLLISNDCCVYIHCHVGMSRSPALVMAYLMKYQNFTKDEAVDHVRQRRGRVIIRENFLNYLEKMLADDQ